MQSLGEHYLFCGNDKDKGKGNLILQQAFQKTTY